MAKNDLEGQGQRPPFSIPAESISGCMFGDSSSNPLKVIARTSRNSYNSESNGQNDLEGQGQMTSIFNTSREYPRMQIWCKFGGFCPNLWRVITRTNRISYNSGSKWPKWPWRSRSTTSIFNTSWEYLRVHVWCKFGDSSPNLWRVIVRIRRIS